MERQENLPVSEKNNNGKSKVRIRVLIFLASLFFLSTGFLIYVYFSTRTSIANRVVAEKAVTDNQRFKLYLQNLEKQYDELGSEYEGLDSLFSREKEKLHSMLNDVEGEKNNTDKVKTDVTKLEISLQVFKEKIRDLEAENRKLLSSSNRYKISYDSLLKVKTGADNKTHTVSKNDLGIGKLAAEGIDQKETPVRETTKVSKIRVCFRVLQNYSADKGSKVAYVRIIDQSGIVLLDNTGGSGEFEWQGKKLMYSMRKSFYFDGNPLDLCMYLTRTEQYKKGKYSVEVYLDKAITPGSFSLE
ncbi:MAG: hypothetical protein WCM76_06545 [Bacteroidota bacterium]